MGDKVANILIIDSSSFIREQLTKYFYQKRQKVFTAHNGQSAIEQIKKVVPDVVLIDINLSDIDATILIQAIKKRHPNSQIIGISSTSDKEKVTNAIGAGISLFKLKPFRIDTLVSEVIKK